MAKDTERSPTSFIIKAIQINKNIFLTHQTSNNIKTQIILAVIIIQQNKHSYTLIVKMKIGTVLFEFDITYQNLNCPFTHPQQFHFQDCLKTPVPEQLYKSKYQEIVPQQGSGYIKYGQLQQNTVHPLKKKRERERSIAHCEVEKANLKS